MEVSFTYTQRVKTLTPCGHSIFAAAPGARDACVGACVTVEPAGMGTCVGALVGGCSLM